MTEIDASRKVRRVNAVAASEPLQILGDRNDTDAKMSKKKPAIEDVYVKKTHLEQILLRPDTYIGSVEKLTQTMTVYDEGVGFRTREVTFVPGLFKIFDEILGAWRWLRTFSLISAASQRGRQQAARRQHERHPRRDQAVRRRSCRHTMSDKCFSVTPTRSRSKTTAAAFPLPCTPRRRSTCPSSSLATSSPHPTTTTMRRRFALG